jgi:hypothetical protein
MEQVRDELEMQIPALNERIRFDYTLGRMWQDAAMVGAIRFQYRCGLPLQDNQVELILATFSSRF